MSTLAARKQSIFVELRQSTLRLLILFICAGTATLIWLGNINSHSSPPEVVILWCIVEFVGAMSWLFQRRHLTLAFYTIVGGLWLCNATAFLALQLDLFGYLFALIALVAGVMMNRLSSLIISLISSAFLLLARGFGENNLILIMSIWLAWLTSLAAFRSLYGALDIAWGYEDYAIKQMSEAREHRAQLMQLTKALSEARADLERANSQLQYANRAAEEARRLKAQFAANVSHELRTPINLIVAFSQTIVLFPNAYDSPLPPAYWADMNTIYRSATHLQSLINDVLDVSQIEAGKMSIVKEETASGQVIQEAANLARDLIESRGLKFEVNIAEPMPIMYLDRTRIRQVILNLLSNAARFTNRGTITLSACVSGTDLEVSVADTGIGISPSELNRVFEEFHQLESSLSRRYGGSGLGLTLSKQFVEMHGGRIRAESEGIPGKGSKLTFTLPLPDQHRVWDTDTPSHRFPTEPADDRGRHFVVYDDDPAILQLFARHSARHKPIGVNSHEEAIRLVERIRPAALILDERNDDDQIRALLEDADHSTPIITCAMPSSRRSLRLAENIIPLNAPITCDELRAALDRLGKTDTVLLISHDLDMIRMLTRLLQAIARPFKILKAYSEEEGLALALQQYPDVIILDGARLEATDMPILQELQSHPAFAAMPTLLVGPGAGDGLTPAAEGKVVIRRATGFQPLELVRGIEALIDTFTPASVSKTHENHPG